MKVEILSRSFTSTLLVPRLDYRVESYEWDAMGGPDIARIEATGDENALWQLRRWLRAPITIVDDNGRKVWWGYVREVTLDVGGIQAGVSLEEMHNAIAVTHSAPEGEAGSERRTTAWAEDPDSILEYGRRELLDSRGDLEANEAQARRDALLKEYRYPLQVTRPALSDGAGAVIECAGWWRTLDWQLHSRAGVSVVYDSGSLENHGICSGDTHKAIAVQIVPAAQMRVRSLWAYVGKVGAPGDSLRVSIVNDDAGKPTGSTVTYGDIAGSALSTGLAWTEVDVTPVTLSQGVTYWFVLSRPSMIYDTGNHFITAVDTSLGYAGLTLRWNVNDWGAPYPNGDLVFKVYDVEQTTDQIAYALTNSAQFIQGVFIEDASGIHTYPYKTGDHTTLYEVEEMLRAGVSGGQRLLATVTPERYVRVYQEPERPSGATRPKYVWGRDAQIRQLVSNRILSSECPVGDWCEIIGVPPVPEGDLLAGSNLFFIEHAIYDATTGEYTPDPRGARGAFDI